jgi:plastocyanin
MKQTEEVTMKTILSACLVFTGLCLSSSLASAADAISIEMKDGKFNPATVEVPVGQKIELKVKNSESVEVEFESYPLNREVKIQPNETKSIFVGPLAAGSFPIFDDNNPDAKGAVVAK